MVKNNDARGIIFDFDGVIIDTVPYHYRSWKSPFEKRGVRFDLKDYLKINGFSREKGVVMVLGKIPKKEIIKVSDEKQAIYKKLLDKKLPPLLPGFRKLFNAIYQSKYRLAIASSSKNCKYISNKLGLTKKTDVLVGGGDFKNPKPSPDIYLVTAKKLKVKPENCIVIEDMLGGIKSAKNAGAHCIALTSYSPKRKLRGADIYIKSLEDLNIKKIEEIFK